MSKLFAILPTIILMMTLPLIGCTTTAPECPAQKAYEVVPPPPPPPSLPIIEESVPPEDPFPKSEMIEIPIVVAPTIMRNIPKGSRIVIADIAGTCALELKNALMKRLVDNSDYEVLTRDNLRQLIGETEHNWTGKFNTRTAARLGELLGASLFIVGNVVYCGQTAVSDDEEGSWQYDLLAVLQILDLETGRVLMSSADQGKFRPRTTQLLVPAAPLDFGLDSAVTDSDEPEAASRTTEANFPIFKAAQDLANGFADKFFSRPSWEHLEMWKNDYWHYGDSIQYVKLGHCSRALNLLESVGAQELHTMPEKFVAEYLHNYGVALLCDNQVQIAMDKLRSAYRITYEPVTLQMLDLAAKFDEWDMEVRPDKEPEIELLMKRRGISAR